MTSRTKALKSKRQRKAAPNRVNEAQNNAQITANVAALRQLAKEEA